MSGPTPPPKDGLGTELRVKDLVTFQSIATVVWQIQDINNGGIHTNRGVTPAVIRLVADVTIAVPPGSNVNNMMKIVTPGAEDALKRILDASPPPRV